MREESWYAIEDSIFFNETWDELLQEVFGEDYSPGKIYRYKRKEDTVEIGKKIMQAYFQKFVFKHPLYKCKDPDFFRFINPEIEVTEEDEEELEISVSLKMQAQRREQENVKEEIQFNGNTYSRVITTLSDWQPAGIEKETLFIPLYKYIFFDGEE